MSGRWSAPVRAAALNGAIVIALWVAFTSAVSSNMPWTYPLETAAQATPFAAVAAWRTWVHAKRWRGDPASLWPIAEAGAVGFLVAIAVLARGIVYRPAEAAPFVIVYGGAALIAGLLLGVLLRTTALLVLWRSE